MSVPGREMPAAGIKDLSWLEGAFARFENSLNGGGIGAFHELRQKSLAEFRARGWPTPREEEWKYTNLAPIFRSPLTPIDPVRIDEERLASMFVPGLEGPRLAFSNGVRIESLCEGFEHSGLNVRNMAACGPEFIGDVRDGLAGEVGGWVLGIRALSLAFSRDGVVIEVAPGVEMEHPVQILFYSEGRSERSLVCPRVVVAAGAGSRACFVEIHRGYGSYTSLPVREIVVGKGARLRYVTLQYEDAGAYQLSSQQIRLEGHALFEAFSIALGGALIRNDLHVRLEGEGIECGLYGLARGRGSSHIDNHSVVEHIRPGCHSHQLYKGVYGDSSKGVFDGTIIVRPGAQKTDAIQTSRTLLLSREATSNAKPQLKIWADDVKCTHAATTGQLDESALFYLRTRGIPSAIAKRMLTEAFVGEVLEKVDEALRECVTGLIGAIW